MLRQLLMGVAIKAVQDPETQKKIWKAADEALKSAKPSLLQASRQAGALTRALSEKIRGHK